MLTRDDDARKRHANARALYVATTTLHRRVMREIVTRDASRALRVCVAIDDALDRIDMRLIEFSSITLQRIDVARATLRDAYVNAFNDALDRDIDIVLNVNETCVDAYDEHVSRDVTIR